MTHPQRMPPGLARELDVSRETEERLATYVALLLRWTRRINLISKSSAETVWDRHIHDSAQLWDRRPAGVQNWLDLGSGGGLPGIVLAILAAEKAPDIQLTLMESDERKGVFLQTVLRELGLSARVRIERIETAAPAGADVITARALAPLVTLLGWAERHRADGCICLFPKGRSYREELTEARRVWHVEPSIIPSRTDPDGVILRIGDFSRA